MALPLRLEYEGARYHVMNRGAGHCTIFHEEAQRQRFLDLLADLFERFGVETHAWCLMDNHYNLPLDRLQANRFRAMRHLGHVYTQHFNRAFQIDGPLCRRRIHHMLDATSDDEPADRAVRYTRNNSVNPGTSQ